MNINNFSTATKSVKLRHRIFLSPVTKYGLSTFAIGGLLTTGVYIAMLLIIGNADDELPATCDIRPTYQVDCLPGQIANYEKCLNVECCWDDKTRKCFHTILAKHSYYSPKDTNGQTVKSRRAYSPLGSKNWPLLYPYVNHVDSEYVQLYLGTRTGTKNRNFTASNEGGQGLSASIHFPEFFFTVTRNGSKTPSLTTARGPLIITQTYWELTIYLGKVTLYAFDSYHANGTTNWLYSNAQSSKTSSFLGITLEGEAIGCYLPYDGPMEIKILNDSNLIIVRGFSVPEVISLHVFASTTPQLLIKRMLKTINTEDTINLIDHSSFATVTSNLGPHVCTSTKNIEGPVVDSVVELIQATQVDRVPWDNHCIYQEFYSTLDKTLNESEEVILLQIQEILKTANKTVVPHLTPMILKENIKLISRLHNLSLILKYSPSEAYEGLLNGVKVAYPEWSDNQTYSELDRYLSIYLNTFGLPNGVFIQDAWPRDDSNYTLSLNFPRFDYLPQELKRLMTNGTIPPNLYSSDGKLHYHQHNAYADDFRAFIKRKVYSLESKDLLFSNVNNVPDKWLTLEATINQAVSSGLRGDFPPALYICGTKPNINEELCTRWYGFAVILPYIMIAPEYMPGGKWLTIGTSQYAKALLCLRASLITYQRTVIHEHYIFGLPLLAPTQFFYPQKSFFEKPGSKYFLWGQSLLIGLVTMPKSRQIQIQIPGTLPWRHLPGGAAVVPSLNGESVSVSVMEGEIAILVRPGHIIPIHENVMMTAVETAQSDIQLMANLACINDDCIAYGKIAYQSGIFLNIMVNQTFIKLENVGMVKLHVCSTTIHQSTVIESVKILGGKSYIVNVDICKHNENTIIEEKLFN